MWPGDDGNWGQSWPSVPPMQMPAAASASAVYQQHCPPGPVGQQVDWAALAQQWIQRQQQPTDAQPPGEEPFSRPIVPNDNFLPPEQQPPYWNEEQTNWKATLTHQPWTGPNAREKETFDYGHVAPAAESGNGEPVTTFDYNHQNSDSLPFDQQQQYVEQYWNQELPKSKGESYSKRSGTNDDNDLTAKMDMMKRKKLPSWLREGLEKMEKEKQRKLDQEKVEQEKIEKKKAFEQSKNMWPVPSKFDVESDGEKGNEDDIEGVKKVPSSYVKPRQESPKSPIQAKVARSPTPPPMTPEEREKDLVMRVRKMLTELLLDVTNSEIFNITREVWSKARSRSVAAKQYASSSALASIASNLGLGSYESDSEVESEADNRKELSDSDSDLETISEKLREKRLAFEKRQSHRIFDDDDSNVNRDSKSNDEKDNNCHDEHRTGNIAATKDESDDSSTSLATANQYENIPGLDIVEIKDEEEKSSSSKKHKKQSSSSSRRRKSRSRSRSSSRSRKKSKRRSRSRDRYRRSRSRDRRRSRSRGRYRSRSRSSSSGSRSHKRSRSRRSRSHSRDRYKSRRSRRDSRSRSRSGSPRKSSKRKSSKYKSGKKAS